MSLYSPKRSEGGCRIVVITSGCQSDDGGSIPLTRSKNKAISSFVFGCPEIRFEMKYQIYFEKRYLDGNIRQTGNLKMRQYYES